MKFTGLAVLAVMTLTIEESFASDRWSHNDENCSREVITVGVELNEKNQIVNDLMTNTNSDKVQELENKIINQGCVQLVIQDAKNEKAAIADFRYVAPKNKEPSSFDPITGEAPRVYQPYITIQIHGLKKSPWSCDENKTLKEKLDGCYMTLTGSGTVYRESEQGYLKTRGFFSLATDVKKIFSMESTFLETLKAAGLEDSLVKLYNTLNLDSGAEAIYLVMSGNGYEASLFSPTYWAKSKIVDRSANIIRMGQLLESKGLVFAGKNDQINKGPRVMEKNDYIRNGDRYMMGGDLESELAEAIKAYGL